MNKPSRISTKEILRSWLINTVYHLLVKSNKGEERGRGLNENGAYLFSFPEKGGGGGLLEKKEDLRWTCFPHFYSPLRVKTLLCAAKAFQSIAVFLTPQLHSDRSKLLFSCNIWDELESLRIVQTPQANLRGFSIVPLSWRFSWASVVSHALSKKIVISIMELLSTKAFAESRELLKNLNSRAWAFVSWRKM